MHQLLDRPLVLDDPLAVRIIGAESESALRADPERFDRIRSLRAFVVMRSRYAEDELKRAVSRGVHQYVILGAGLDTSAYRNTEPGLRIFAVDHSATQAWKCWRLDEADIAIPRGLTFVPIDFEAQTLSAALVDRGFRADEPAFFPGSL